MSGAAGAATLTRRVPVGVAGAAIAVAAAGLALANPTAAVAATLAVVLGLLLTAGADVAVLALVVLAPWTTLLNALLGGRFTGLGADLLVIAVTVLLVATTPRRLAMRRSARVAAVAVVACLAVGVLQILNPRGLGFVGGLEGYRGFFVPMLGFLAALRLAHADARFPDRLLVALLASATLVALMGIRQAFAFGDIDRAIIENASADALVFQMTGTNRLRAFSPMPGPFHFGLLMCFGILATITSALHRLRAWQLVVLPILLTALGLNATRLNWAGTAAGIVVALVLSLGRGRLAAALPKLAGFLAVGALAIVALARLPQFSVLNRFATSFAADPTANTSYAYRVLGWLHDIIPAIRAHPLVGYGTGMAKDGLGPFTSHNVFFKILLEGGALLFVPYLIVMGATIVAALRSDTTLARTAVAMIVALHVAGMFGPLVDAYPANLFFWLVLGAAVGTRASGAGRQVVPAVGGTSTPSA
jgi:hypothetical protein